MLPVFLATNSTDRGSTSRTLEAWLRLFPALGVQPFLSLGGDGPLKQAVDGLGVREWVRPLRYYPRRTWPVPYVRAVLRLASAIGSSGARLVHLNEHEFHRVVAHAALRARVPIVTHIRFKPERAHCEWLFRPPYQPKRIFFTSETQMRDCEPSLDGIVPRERWRLVYNGLDLTTYGNDRGLRERQRAQWGLAPSTVAIGIACAISERKRLDHFLRLIGRLKAHGLDVRGFIAGVPIFDEDEALYRDLQAQARSLGLADTVMFLGYVEPSEPLYHAWDLCISTSSYESFGMAVLEAMACHCAVVAYPGGAVAEVVGDAGVQVDDGDEDALLRACLSLASDTQRRQAVARAGRARAEMFDVKRSARMLAVEYADVLKESAAQH